MHQNPCVDKGETALCCPFCKLNFLAKAIRAHVCRKAPNLELAPHDENGRRRLTEAEISQARKLRMPTKRGAARRRDLKEGGAL
jgi:hypothetical protein